jgi:hypothetical protein
VLGMPRDHLVNESSSVLHDVDENSRIGGSHSFNSYIRFLYLIQILKYSDRPTSL